MIDLDVQAENLQLADAESAAQRNQVALEEARAVEQRMVRQVGPVPTCPAFCTSSVHLYDAL